MKGNTKKVVKKSTTNKKTVNNKVASKIKEKGPLKIVETQIIEKKRKGNKKNYNDLYLYSSAIAIILVLSNSISYIPFTINNVDVSLSVFSYPFIFLFSCLIYKKYGLWETIESLIVAVVIQMLMFFLRWIIFEEVELKLFISSLISFGLSQFICVYLYHILLENELENYLYVFLILTISILFDNVIFLTFLKLFGDQTIGLEILNVSNLVKLGMSALVSLIVSKIKL